MSKIPNLDSLSKAQLEQWVSQNTPVTISSASELFPSRPQDYIEAAELLLHFGLRRLYSLKFLEKGDLEASRLSDKIADGIYRELPGYAKFRMNSGVCP